MEGRVIAVACEAAHRFGKSPRGSIELLAGLGVAGDAHCGASVRHRSRVARTPGAANLRQVHLIHHELLAELRAAGFDVAPGALGENVTTSGIALLALPRATRLRLGGESLVELTGLRNPCVQIDTHIGPGAMAATLGRSADGSLVRKAGVMAVVLESGLVRPGDAVLVEHLPHPGAPLEPV
jgi:MOSC domain-containing protein YiiM